MPRKIKLAFIENKPQRDICFKKRTKSLLKKTEELSTLCGVPACCIIYNNDVNAQPEIFPSSYQDTMDVVSRFDGLTVYEKSRRMVDQESYAKDEVEKIEKQLRKLKGDNKEKEIKCVMSQLWGGKNPHMVNDVCDLKDVIKTSCEKLEEINKRIELLKEFVPLGETSVVLPTIEARGVSNEEEFVPRTIDFGI